MGASQSSSQTHPPSRALHILRVTPSSPASHTNIEPFFDFVVGFEGDSLTSGVDLSQLEKIVEGHEGRPLNLLIWNSKHQGTRVVPVVPSRSWSTPYSRYANGNELDPGTRPSLLGLSMRMCEPEVAMDNVWHVLDVLEGSPAESAGLVPYGDWIVGWSGGVLSGENDFYELVEDHIDKPLRVYVYSYDFDTLREVVLVPNRQWGGEGLLGCVFGFGLLHRIPHEQERLAEVNALDSQEEYEEQELFAPVDSTERTYDHEMPGSLPADRQYFRDTAHLPEDNVEHPEQTRQRHSHNTDQTSPNRTGNAHPQNPGETSPSNEMFASQWTPRKTRPIHSIPTPIRSPLFGTVMNGGPGTARLLSPRAGTPIAGFRSHFPHFPESREAGHDESEDEGDVDHDGEVSVAGTEPGSDTHSLGSLTSVE